MEGKTTTWGDDCRNDSKWKLTIIFVQLTTMEKTSITQGSYFLNIALQYFKNFEKDCKMGAKMRAKSWVQKIQYVENDVMSAITPESREIFRQEIKNGDTLFFQAINEKYLMLTPQQRDTIEAIIDKIINGEEIIVENENDY